MPTADTIRPATTADLPAIRALLVETWHATYDNLYGARRVTEITDDWHSLKNLSVQLGREGTVFLVAVMESGIIGTSLARAKDNGQVMLDRLYVRPAMQGQGIGQKLLEATLARFPANSIIRLEVEPQNVTAIRFYERQGFVTVSCKTDCGGAGSAIAASIMERIPVS
jgi:ribosomal protein S18 acetylase RimI-like enzyme